MIMQKTVGRSAREEIFLAVLIGFNSYLGMHVLQKML